jgi:acyl-CoA synthetase
LKDVLEHLSVLGLNRRKWPEYVLLVEQIAMMPSGKIDRRAMAALAKAI